MRNRVAAGVGKERWRLGLELRQDAFLTTDRASLDAYYPVPAEEKAGAARQLRAAGTLFFLAGAGTAPRAIPSTARASVAERASIALSGAVYGKQRLRERSVQGTLTYRKPIPMVLQRTHSDANSRMTYPFMGDAPGASGAGLSLAATLPLAPAWTLRVQADDLASRLRWKNLPVNTESLASDVTSYDENGYVNYAPLLSGRKQQVDRSFRIPRYTAAVLDYRNGDWGAGVQVARYAGETMPTLSLSRRVGWLTLLGNVETRFDSAGIGIEAGNLRLMLQSDRFKLDEAKARSLQLHYHVVL